MKKLKLNDLKVKSFVTDAEDFNSQTIRGGGLSAGFCTYDDCKSYLASNCSDCNPTWQRTCRFC
ncbi:hypothetical protein C900_00270 [Fulvivirga imtechensis AK7]|uniref:Uncharacterized protein n=1 Tax=Fulvivirga imtechensis AK7 TaxID=1237149 RepID=L8JLX3_9BACT|nr:pinensin family lanthipeptide [Fulvivirga imtechensis]ELR68529.1 hypothetical protein C900_00270 [Fulvivirga imtechensis AK7]